jgi:hypothetical protein
MRRGKKYAWGPTFDDTRSEYHVRKRLKLCLEQFLPEAASEVGSAPPANIIEAAQKRRKQKRKREEDQSYILPHLRSPSPPTSTMKLAPLLALPQTYTDIMLSPSMRHSLGEDTVETGLQRTAGELLEGEKGLMQALGRLREVLRIRRRDVPDAEPDAPVVNGHSGPDTGSDGPAEESMQVDTQADGDGSSSPARDAALIPPLPHISETDNLWRVTQELLQANPQPTITYASTQPGTAKPTFNPIPTLTPVHRLFVCPTGMTVGAVPNPSHPGLSLDPKHHSYPQTIRYNLDLANQCRAVDDAMERIAELLTDCNEYKERLEEARERVADVARARKKVWAVIKERAGRELDRAEGK